VSCSCVYFSVYVATLPYLHCIFSTSLCVSLVLSCTGPLSLYTPDKNGNRILIGICSMNIVLYILTYFFYRTINKRRDAIWSAMSAKVGVVIDISNALSEPFIRNSRNTWRRIRTKEIKGWISDLRTERTNTNV